MVSYNCFRCGTISSREVCPNCDAALSAAARFATAPDKPDTVKDYAVSDVQVTSAFSEMLALMEADRKRKLRAMVRRRKAKLVRVLDASRPAPTELELSSTIIVSRPRAA